MASKIINFDINVMASILSQRIIKLVAKLIYVERRPAPRVFELSDVTIRDRAVIQNDQIH